MRPDANSESDAEFMMQRPGALKVSKMICAIFSRCATALSGGSVSSTDMPPWPAAESGYARSSWPTVFQPV